MPTPRSKTIATWAALLGGGVGLHRFYLHGLRDAWGWLHMLPTLIGAWGWQRVAAFGQDDPLSWLLLPIWGLAASATFLQGIVLGLTPDERWHARHNPQVNPAHAPKGHWLTVLGVALCLLLGATVLMATIAYAGQRFFEHQIEEARKLSQ